MATEGLTLEFDEAALDRIASIAAEVNARTENIGARRLHTVMEKLLEDLSFKAPEMGQSTVHIDEAEVSRTLKDIAEDLDLSRYIL